ncbi:MAG TPA: energy transducer TonB [Bryobacteraceae bacterium]|nr:energy transducer TonB [Bryobacteraceae bacterium]
MFARPRPAPFVLSVLTHGLLLGWVASGRLYEKPKSLYAETIAPHASKLVWYDFREKLPDVSPPAARKPALPRVEMKIASQEVVADSLTAPRARQFIWQPAPKLELQKDLTSPNVVAIHTPQVQPLPKPKLFVPPPEAPRAAADAPTLSAAPEIQTARTLGGPGNVLGMQPVKAPPRAFVAPTEGGGRKPSPLGAPLPEAPALSEAGGAAPASMAIVGLDPKPNAPPPAPEGSRDARFSAGPQPRSTGVTDGSAEGAMLSVPGLLVRNGGADSKPALMARGAPTAAGNLREALHNSVPAATASPGHPAAMRVATSPDPMLDGRAIYAMSVQMPNITSYTGSWMIWFAERQRDSPGSVLSPPVPLRKVDPKYYQAAIADRVEGRVRLAAVIRKDGQVDSVRLLQHLDDRLDQSAAEAMDKWRFEPALRNGQPVDIDAVIEIPFRLAPKTPR